MKDEKFVDKSWGDGITTDPYLMSVLSSRMFSIGIEMTNTMIRSARSLLMSICRDLSTAICDRNTNVISLPPCIPVHVANMGLTVTPALSHPDGVQEGDLFLNNSPYTGNTHHADYTYIAPVFNEGELMFWAAAKGHQADCGNSIPSTYHPTAVDLYEEGAIDWPCVKIQRDYKDVHDLIQIARMRIRVPDQWYGDYLAGVGSARIGERRLKAMCEEYGNDVIKEFCNSYQEYGKKRMIEEIKKLPSGTWEYRISHDRIPDLLPQIDIHIIATINAEEGYITIDLRDNEDSLCGLNLCEATAVASARTGLLNRMPVDMPHNSGAMSRIQVLTREGCVVGKSKYPYSSSLATTNVADRLISGVQCLFNQIAEMDSRGLAEGGAVQCPAVSVISGKDWRRNEEPYINQLFCGMTGGPGASGHDGWVTYQYPCTGGGLYWTSTEILEQRYPVMVLEEEVIPDGIGSGQWDSAPSCQFILSPRQLPMMSAYSCDGQDNLPKGAKGGCDGHKSGAWKYTVAQGLGSKTPLPPFANPEIKPGEAIVSHSSSGGGYGNPLDRDPELVRHRVREGWITLQYAKDVYGVVIDTGPELFAVDEEATRKLRQTLKKTQPALEKEENHG